MACLSVLLYRRVNSVGKWICCYHTGMKILNLCGLVFGLLAAQHGSWNRAEKAGYRISYET